MKNRIYIFQFLGLLLLLCCYLYHNIPDSLSDMSFNLKNETVFSKAHKHPRNNNQTPAKVSKNDSRHRSNEVKHISFEVVIPQKLALQFHPVEYVVHTYSLIEGYYYLYYLEINPPPPKRDNCHFIAVA